MQQVAAALQYAHNRKLVHRDVKPDNMLLAENYEVLLSDFGIALVTQSSRHQSTQEVVGTVAYMAPEQLQGKPGLASDQYALGIVVYEWLCGNRPFHGTFIELYSQHLNTPPPSLREKIPTISPDVEQVVLTALAKVPQQRFTSIKAFATALVQASESAQFPTPAPPSKPLEPTIASIPPSQHLWPAVPVSSASQPLRPGLINTPSVEHELTKRGVSRRTVLTSLAGLTVAGIVGGITWLALSQKQQISPSGPKLLYEADWSNGLNGWAGTSDWSILNGMLHNDGTDSSFNSPTIVAPYQVVGVADYAVEVRVQVLAGNDCLDVTTIRASVSTSGRQGYKASVGCNSLARIDAGSTEGLSFDVLTQASFTPDNNWHIYRFEAKGNKLSLMIDGQLILMANDNRYSSGGKLGFKSFETQLNISSYKVFTV